MRRSFSTTRGRWRFFAVGLAAFATPSVRAVDMTPFPLANRNPLVQIFGLPSLGSARPLASGTTSAELSYDIANLSYTKTQGTDRLILDGEVHRLNLRLAHGTNRGEWGVELPYVSHDPGVMDRFIRRWHEIFGLPQGNREEVDDNQLQYFYQRDGIERVNLSQPREGIGDVRFVGAWSLTASQGVDWALRASLKLPTGDADNLLGSGGTDIAVWTVIACNAERCPARWAWHSGLGILRTGNSDLFADQQRQTSLFGGAGLHWAPWDRVTLKGSLYLHTPLFEDTGFRPLDRTSVQLLLGTAWTTARGTAIELGVSEDLRVETAPDVGITLNVRTTY